MIDVLFLIHDLSVGGAEKVLVNLVNHMNKEKFNVTVLSLFDEGVNKEFLGDDIIYKYAFKKAIRGNSHLMKLFTPQYLYKKIVKDEYDIVISFLEGPSTRVVSGCLNDNTKIVSWVHSTIRTDNELSASFRSFKEAYACYSSNDKIVFVSEDTKKAFLNVCPLKDKALVLYNTNESDEIIKKSKEVIEDFYFKNDTFYWCGVGKLVDNKGFDRMIRIQNKLISEGYKVELIILGVGPKESELVELCESKGVSNSVHFLGYKKNPYKYIAKCNLFVCASHSEGFSTAATESLIVGTPICTVDVSGMKEMLGKKNEYGLIVNNNEEDLYFGIKKLLDDKELLATYREKTFIRKKIFSTSSTVKSVENMLINLAEDKI